MNFFSGTASNSAKKPVVTLLYTNSQRVWRRRPGDYWLLDLNTKALRQLDFSNTASPDVRQMLTGWQNGGLYVSETTFYVEDLASGIRKLTDDKGTPKLINGTFDWVYEKKIRRSRRLSMVARQPPHCLLAAGGRQSDPRLLHDQQHRLCIQPHYTRGISQGGAIPLPSASGW